MEKVTRPSLKGVLKQGPFACKNGDFTNNFAPLGHRTFKRQICLKKWAILASLFETLFKLDWVSFCSHETAFSYSPSPDSSTTTDPPPTQVDFEWFFQSFSSRFWVVTRKWLEIDWQQIDWKRLEVWLPGSGGGGESGGGLQLKNEKRFHWASLNPDSTSDPNVWPRRLGVRDSNHEPLVIQIASASNRAFKRIILSNHAVLITRNCFGILFCYRTVHTVIIVLELHVDYIT